MDKRIKLTAKQQSLIKRMRKLITKMQVTISTSL